MEARGGIFGSAPAISKGDFSALRNYAPCNLGLGPNYEPEHRCPGALWVSRELYKRCLRQLLPSSSLTCRTSVNQVSRFSLKIL